jgi:hypothetical protein
MSSIFIPRKPVVLFALRSWSAGILAGIFLFSCALAPARSKPADGAAETLGTWEGESKCTVPSSPCHDEHVNKDKSDPERLLIGVNSTTEYKTRVASSIAANISPVPSYYVYECHKPGEPNSKLCVVQVRNANSFHLLTKKNIKPIHVCNEDETREADAADIRRLLERNRLTEDFSAKLMERANEIPMC